MEDNTIPESACKSRLACDYAQRSDELLEYVGFLETELQNIKSETRVTQVQHELESRDLKDQLDVALNKMNEAHRELHAQLESGRDMQTVQHLKKEFHKTENLLQEEQKREKDLEAKIQELELELERKNELINHRRKRDDRARRQLENENESLKKKATLAWMLGCLSDVYLQLEPEHKSAALLKMVRKIQRELERENVVLSYSCKPPKIECNFVENEIRRLIECSQSTQKRAADVYEDRQSEKGHRSIEEEYIAEIARSEKGEQGMKKHPRKASKSAQNRSALQTVQQSFQPLGSEICSPRARFIVNCFDNPAATRREVFRSEQETEDSPRTDTSQSQIEVFEANPYMDVEHTRMTGSTWAELKVLNRRAAERAEMYNCQSDIKRMLSNIEMSIAYLIEQERHRKWKEAQLKHLGYQPMQEVPESALWKRKPWQF